MSKRGQIIHSKRFMDGQITPEELHQSLAFPIGAKCKLCGRPPMIAIRSYGEEAEMIKRDQNLRIFATVDPEKYASMLIKTKAGRFIRIGEVYACSHCAPQAEREAAHHPSWCFVDIDRGPGPDRVVVGYRGPSILDQ